MQVREAVDFLDGHAILKVEAAQEICRTVGVPFKKDLVMWWGSSAQANQKYGFFAASEGPGSGVNALDLSYHVVKQLGIDPAPGAAYVGKGYQARANQRAIRRRLSELGKL